MYLSYVLILNTFYSYQGPISSTEISKIEKHSTSKVVVVNVLSLEDSKCDLVNVIDKYEDENIYIKEEFVEDSLITRGQPDPELVITIGLPSTTLGFLPWQIKFSEFMTISSFKRLNYKKFRSILESYSNCEQRLGK